MGLVSVTPTKVQLGYRLGRHLVLARVAAGNKDVRSLADSSEAAVAAVEQLRNCASEVEGAYLDLVIAAAKLGADAAHRGEWTLAYDVYDLTHNIGELWVDRMDWDHGFFIKAFAEAFVEKHVAATAVTSLHGAIERLRGVLPE